MKHIKPGRGPSLLSGVMSVFMALFGVLWICAVAGAGGGWFALFGVVFVGIAVVNAVYSFRNARRKNRYSAFDIVDSAEEPDPLDPSSARQSGIEPYRTNPSHTEPRSIRQDSADPGSTKPGSANPGRSSPDNAEAGSPTPGSARFCPYCGRRAAPDHAFCSNCGKKLP